jgi:hypothetical protein
MVKRRPGESGTKMKKRTSPLPHPHTFANARFRHLCPLLHRGPLPTPTLGARNPLCALHSRPPRVICAYFWAPTRPQGVWAPTRRVGAHKAIALTKAIRSLNWPSLVRNGAFALAPLRWRLCADAFALAPLRWRLCAGAFALAPLRWRLCAGAFDPCAGARARAHGGSRTPFWITFRTFGSRPRAYTHTLGQDSP